jgi:hypothetical protein
MAYYDNADDIQQMMPSLSPLLSAGIDPDEALASGDPQGMLAAARAGVPYQSQAQKAAQASPAASMLAQAAAPPTPRPAAPTGARTATPSEGVVHPALDPDLKAEQLGHLQQRAQEAQSTLSGTPMNSRFSPAARARWSPSQTPATNAPNPPSEQPNIPAVPGTVTPSGSPVPASFQSAAEGQMGAARRAETQEAQLEGQSTADSKLAPLATRLSQLQSPADPNNPDGVPNPKDPQYRPSVGKRIERGLVAGVEGLARGGIRGAVLGAVDPAAAGATPYGAPTGKFSQASQRNQELQQATQGQIGEGEKAFGLDTARTKENIASVKDIGAMYGDVAKTFGADQKADYQNQLADVKKQVADYQQAAAENKQPKLPTTYEATVAAAHLETDPANRAALESAAREMADTEIKKFSYKAAQDGGGNSSYRQSAIDNATQQVQALQDGYTYNPRRNTYIDDKGNELTPAQFTDKKNQIATKLDQQLTAKKLKPLGVRFNPADAGANKPTGRAATSATTAAKPVAQPPASLLSKTPEGHSVVGLGGETWVKRGGQWAQQ